MKKHLLIILAVISIVFGSFYYIKITEYLSLSNPIQELYYGETRYKNFLVIPPFSKLIRSNQAYSSTESWIRYPANFINEGEQLALFVSRYDAMFIEYKKKLFNGVHLIITYYYNNSRLIETVEISYGNLSSAFAQQQVEDSKKDGLNVDETIAGVYKFYNLDYPKQKNMINPTEVLEYLKPYHIDKAWLEKKSHEILYDDFLNIWFEKGSQRYSKDNLGDLKIERADIFR